ncbi:MAG: hypothetical protein ABJL18_10185 [Hyphomicrobiales bacterium]
MWKKIFGFAPWLLLVSYRSSDLLTTLHGLPDGLNLVLKDLQGIVMTLTYVEILLAILGLLSVCYVFWPEFVKLLPNGRTDDTVPTRDDKSIHNGGHNFGIQNTGDIYNKPPQRRLGDEDKRFIIESFDKGHKTTVRCESSAECESYAKEISLFLRESGFNDLHWSISLMGYPAIKGQTLHIERDGEQVIIVGEQ